MNGIFCGVYPVIFTTLFTQMYNKPGFIRIVLLTGIAIAVALSGCKSDQPDTVSTHQLVSIQSESKLVPAEKVNGAEKIPLDTSTLPVHFAGPLQQLPTRSNVRLPGQPTTTPAQAPVITTPGTDTFAVPISFTVVPTMVKAGSPEIIPAKDMGNKFQNGGNFSFFNKAQGLSSNIIISLLEDTQGNIWFGSVGGGVIRYDGESFAFFSKKQGFGNASVLSMVEDNKGVIWFSGDKLLTSFDGNSFAQYDLTEQLHDDAIGYMVIDARGHLLFTGDSGGLFRFDGTSFLQYTPAHGLPAMSLGHLFIDHADQLWISAQNKGLIKFDRNSFYFYKAAAGIPKGMLRCINEDADGNIWLGYYNGGVVRFDGNQFDWYTAKQGLSNDYVWSIYRDRNDNMWFGTDNGATMYDGKHFTVLTEADGLSNNFIWDMLQDRNGHMWFATYGGGVSKYAGHRFTHLTQEEGLSRNIVNNIMEDRHGDLWMGTWSGYALKYDGESFYHFSEKNGLTNFNVWTTHEDDRGRIWFGTNTGVYSYDGTHCVQITNKQGLINNVVHCMTSDPFGNLWMGTQMGLSRFDGDTIYNYSGDNLLNGHFISALHTDRHGHCWIGMRNGLLKYDGQHFYEFTSVGQQDIASVFEDAEGALWIGTFNSGVIKYDGTRFTWITAKEGLLNDRIVSISEDELGNMIFGTPNGLSILTREKQHQLFETSAQGDIREGDVFFENHGYEDGFLGVGCNRNSILTASGGKVWIGTNDRLTIYHPKSILESVDSISPSIQLTKLDLFNEAIPWTALDENRDTSFVLGNGVTVGNFSFSGFSQWHQLPEQLSLSHDNNYLTFHFIGITSYHPKKVKYQYKLEGIDRNWSALTTANKATYGNLPDGNYTFHVKAMNAAGYWSDELTYALSIRPPWWQTWWMYVVYGFVAMAAIALYIKWRERTLRSRFNEIEGINKKLADLTQTQHNTLNLFIKYVPEPIVKKALEDRPDSIFEGEQQDVAVLFCDIRDFTPISEHLKPNQVVTLLNTYYSRMNEVIRLQGGVINQFVGDEIFVIFGAPVPIINIEESAVRCAIGMIEQLNIINAELQQMLGVTISVGIGINFGPVVTGNLGCEDRISYSVTGDTVNTANRIENLTRNKPNSILISESVYGRIKDLITTKAWEPIDVKGKHEKMRVYEVLGLRL
jgi:ligand-binding sensor domain-containing protein/class 3 adenylate cyclase